MLTKDSILEKKKNILLPSQIFIDGKYVNSIEGAVFENISPIDGKILNSISFAQKKDVDLAVSVARKTFEKGSWSNAAPSHRKKVMLRFAELLEQHQLELALLDTMDVGKTINDTYNADLPASVDNIRWYAEIVDKIYD